MRWRAIWLIDRRGSCVRRMRLCCWRSVSSMETSRAI